MMSKDRPEYKQILIIQTAFLGDVILITPLIKATAQLFPGARIDALVLPQTKSILENNPHLSQILTFEKRSKKWKAFWKTVRAVRKNRYDLAISPHSSITTAYLMLLSGVKERLGFDRWHAARYLTLKVPHLQNCHKIKKNLHLLSVFSTETFSMETELFPAKADIEKYGNFFSTLNFKDRPVIALAPGSIWFTKRWPKNHYIELTKMLEKSQFNLIFIGGPEEADLASEIIKESNASALNFAGNTSPLESAAILKNCDLLICNDSGAMHIANAVQTEVIAFFGPTVQSIGYFPYRAHDIVMELEMKCRPCGSHGGAECPLLHHKCMTDITPQMVFKQIAKKYTAG